MIPISINDRKHEQAILNQKFHEACKIGDLDQVQYLLESPELALHANIHSDNDLGLRLASTFKQVRVIDYILSSPLFVPPSFHSKYSVLEKAQEQVMEYLMSREDNTISSTIPNIPNIPNITHVSDNTKEKLPEEINVEQMKSQLFFQNHYQRQLG